MTEKLTYWFATKVYCNSLNLKKEIEYKMTNKPVGVIGNGSVNGVDMEYFKETLTEKEKYDIYNNIQIEPNDFVITFVGRIVKDKGINELLKVFISLKEKYTYIKLLLIGDYENDLDPISHVSREAIEKDEKIIHVKFQQDKIGRAHV